jgi:hypothetical protein
VRRTDSGVTGDHTLDRSSFFLVTDTCGFFAVLNGLDRCAAAVFDAGSTETSRCAVHVVIVFVVVNEFWRRRRRPAKPPYGRRSRL